MIDDKTRLFKVVSDEEEKKQNKKEKRKRITINILASLVVFIIITGLVVGVYGLNLAKNIVKDAPELNIENFVGNESTKIYDRNNQLIQEIGTYLRENISYEELPEGLIDAFVSIEDSRYFEHFGFDIPRFSKAILVNLKSGSFAQGGSTFTMQLVKNTYFQLDKADESTIAEKKIDRKVKEIYLAVKLNKELDKKKIMELYLNKINFGANIRGVERASKYYFGKSAKETNLSEQALLAGIVNRPNDFNPFIYLDNATKRRNEVIDMMKYHGYITEEEANLTKSINLVDTLANENKQLVNSSDSQYRSYIDTVINEAQGLTGKDPYVVGMNIYTAMDKTVQSTMDSIQDGSADIPFPDELMQVALITVDNKTGEILGIGGGRNYNGARLLNRATDQYKQPGSSVKPILSYALAYEYLGFTDKQVLVDRPITYPYESRVLVNFDDKYRGDVTIQQAFAQSLNIPAILTLQQVVDSIGKEAVVSYMNSLGYTRVHSDNFHLSYAIGGTTFETTVYEMSGAASMLMNGGIYNKPHTVNKIVDQYKKEYYPQDQNKKIISSGSAYLVTQLMKYAVEGPYFNYMQILKRPYPVYAKTGTSDWGSDGIPYGIPKGAAKDKWMISSTSNYTNVIWVGYDKAIKNKGTYYTAYKSNLNIPGRISKLLLDTNETLKEELPKEIERPSDVEEITYVYGTYPLARYEDWMNPQYKTTALISKAGRKDLVDIKDSLNKQGNQFNGVSATVYSDGNISVNWSIGNGVCFGDQKDISLHDQWNNVEAVGSCLFDYSWIVNSDRYYGAKIYSDDNYVGDITGYNAHFSGYTENIGGNIKVCGWYSEKDYTSETKCSIAKYVETPLPTEE